MATKLHVHKNKVESRRRKQVRSDMVKAAQGIPSSRPVIAYAIVALSEDGTAMASWDTGGVIPMWSFASTVSAILQSDIEQNIDAEDYKAPLRKGRWC